MVVFIFHRPPRGPDGYHMTDHELDTIQDDLRICQNGCMVLFTFTDVQAKTLE